MRGYWRTSPFRTSAVSHSCSNSSTGRCRAFATSSGTNLKNSNLKLGVGSGIDLRLNRGGRRLRTRAVLSARRLPLVFLSSSSSSSSSFPAASASASSSSSQLPLSTAAAISSPPPPPPLAGSAAAEPGSGSAFGGGEGEAEGGVEGEWPIPHPSQAFVARARDGAQYEHDVRGAGARRIRAVVSDLDGTLLGPDKLVSARTLEAVRRARWEADGGDGG